MGDISTLQVKLQTTLDVMLDALVIINDKGIIDTFNSAAEKIFGYSQDEVKGLNVKVLMPEPYRSKHDGYLQHYKETGDKHIIGIGREVTGRRKNGFTFPANLAISEMLIDGNKMFVGLIRDLTDVRLNQELIENSRLSGMADVAASIIHNVGNELNGINVSSKILIENLQNSDLKTFRNVCDLLQQHADNLSEYLAADKKEGKVIPELLLGLINAIQTIFISSRAEVVNIADRAEYIRNILIAQEPLTVVNSIYEKIRLGDIMRSAIILSGCQATENKFELIEEYYEVKEIFTDRLKLMQILINLLQNAKNSLLGSQADKGKLLRVIIKPSASSDKILISIIDNGVGVPKEKIKNIFSHDFSNNKDAFGKGLHSSAIAASVLGGGLNLKSDGIGLGAQLILELPIIAHKPGKPNSESDLRSNV